jgi:hypothetical protein
VRVPRPQVFAVFAQPPRPREPRIGVVAITRQHLAAAIVRLGADAGTAIVRENPHRTVRELERLARDQLSVVRTVPGPSRLPQLAFEA